MIERAPAPLTDTLSIKQGMSVGRVVTDVAAMYGIQLPVSATDTLQAANRLYTHIDSRLDGDKPNSVPLGDGLDGDEIKEGFDLPWTRYFAQLREGDGTIHDPQLTDDQTDAFANMRAVMDANGMPEEQRRAFGRCMVTWTNASEHVKTAPNMVGNGSYASGRQWEGRLLANAFATVLPVEAHAHPKFEDFRKMLGRLIAGYKLVDSVLDLPKDMNYNNTALRSRNLGRISLLMPIVMGGIGIAVRKPSLVVKVVQKALAAKANAGDTLNASRTQV